jgi:hypothetical protein
MQVKESADPAFEFTLAGRRAWIAGESESKNEAANGPYAAVAIAEIAPQKRNADADPISKRPISRGEARQGDSKEGFSHARCKNKSIIVKLATIASN